MKSIIEKIIRYKHTLELLNSKVFKNKLLRDYFISNIFFVSMKFSTCLVSDFASSL